MTIKESILAWASRMLLAEDLNPDSLDLVIQRDGFVYAMPKGDHDQGAVKWWLLPYLGPEGEASLASGELYDEE